MHTAVVDGRGRYGQPWTAEEITLALYLYCQIPFARTKANNPMVRALAEHLDRTPASVARKLGNFGSFDPTLAERDVSGLGHASKTDRDLWHRYAEDWAALVDAAVALWSGVVDLATLFPTEHKPKTELHAPSGPSQTQRLTNARLHQAFFRRAVLTSYGDACCACGIEIPALLTASHIVPWAHDERLRADPTNGLCLCALHDRAFDRGLIAVSSEGRILTSPSLRKYTSDASRVYLAGLEGSLITMPHRFAPSNGHVAWHRDNVFQAR